MEFNPQALNQSEAKPLDQNLSYVRFSFFLIGPPGPPNGHCRTLVELSLLLLLFHHGALFLLVSTWISTHFRSLHES